MKEIQKVLLAGTMLAGAAALATGPATATDVTAGHRAVAAPAILMAQADTRDHDADKAGAKRRDKEDAKADDKHEGRKAEAAHPGKRAQDEHADDRTKKAEKRDAKPDEKRAAEKPAHGAKGEADHREPAAAKDAHKGADARPAKEAPAAAAKPDHAADRNARDDDRNARDRDRNQQGGHADDRGRRDARDNDRNQQPAGDRGQARDHDRDHGPGSARDDHDHDHAGDHDHAAGRNGPDRGPDRRVVVQEPGRTVVRVGDRTVIHADGRVIVRHDDVERLRRNAADVRVVTGPGGTRTTTIVRPNGVRIITTEDAQGRLLRRVREQNGRRFVLVENRPDVVVVRPVVLPPLRLTIPRDRYIVEADRAPPAEIEETLMAPPVEKVERRYTLDEVLQNERLRQMVRRVDLSTITFATGSWVIPADEVGRLAEIGRAIAAVVRKNPDAVFLIGGHTDAVGSAEDNLTLSDHRAESVASALTDSFGVPPENLVTQGYGEQYLKVQTDGPEQANRRVTIRNITPLLQQQASQ
ncbi:MAG TPA: OmpA family protein [Hyphomicrobiales bacterium]|nr:OmpA family protein [Hyphomicrobiales bacterium]